MAQSHFHSSSEIESAFRFQRPDLVDLLLEIRSIVATVTPSATERISSRGLTFYNADKGGTIKGGICFVELRSDLVRLSFGLGAFLEDPKPLLRGDRQFKRFLDISSFDDAPWEDIKALIQASANLEVPRLGG